jgi:hypothetical protein
MSSIPHRIFIDDIGKDSAADSKAEFTRYVYRLGGQGFATNGKEIYMPYNVKDSMQMEVQAAVVHERYGHGTFTDFIVVSAVGQYMPWLSDLLNGFEDIMVDHRCLRRYPQYTTHYNRLLTYCLRKIDEDLAAGGKLTIEDLRKRIDNGGPPEMRIILELIWQAYPKAVTAGLGKHHPLTDQVVLDFLAKHEKLLAAMVAAAKSNSATTKKNRSLAIKMYELIHGKGKKPEPPAPDDWKLEDDERITPPPGSGECDMPGCECGCH